jgi:hypothetical protein
MRGTFVVVVSLLLGIVLAAPATRIIPSSPI